MIRPCTIAPISSTTIGWSLDQNYIQIYIGYGGSCPLSIKNTEPKKSVDLVICLFKTSSHHRTIQDKIKSCDAEDTERAGANNWQK